jgi:hypothetical protein
MRNSSLHRSSPTPRFAGRVARPVAGALLVTALVLTSWVMAGTSQVAAEGETSPAVACAYLQGRVPPAVIQAAMANPDKVYGYLQSTNPNRRGDSYNPPRTSLTLANPNLVWNALSNPVIFKAGCPRPAGMP